MTPGREFFHIDAVKRITTATEAINYLHQVETADRWGQKYVVLDCLADTAKNIIIEHVRNVQLGKRTYHYLLSGLVSELSVIFILLFFFFVSDYEYINNVRH